MTAFPVAGVRGPFVVSAQAQVPAIAVEPGNAEKQKDARALAKLQKSLKEVEVNDPASALGQYRAFLASRPNIQPEAGILVNHLIAQLLYKQGDADGAIGIYDRTYIKYKEERESLGLLTEKAALLLAQDTPEKTAEAATLLLKSWPEVEQSESQTGSPTFAGPMLYQLSLALQRQGKKDRVVSLLEEAFTSVPALLNEEEQGQSTSKFAGQVAGDTGWMYEVLTSLLAEQGKQDRALSWAKVRWMTASFEAPDVERAARMMVKEWGVAAPKGIGLITFGVEQKDAITGQIKAQANAYDKIELPSFDADKLQEQLKEMRNKDGKTLSGQTEEKINLHMLLGQWNEAMSEAVSYLVARPSSMARVQQVASVFKAADGDLVRANDFTVFFREGKGDNPLTSFFKEYPKSDKVTSPPPVPASVLLAQVAAASGQIKPGAPYAAPISEDVLTLPLVTLQLAQAPRQEQMTPMGERGNIGLLTKDASLLLAQDENAEAEALLAPIWPQVARNERQFAEPTFAGPLLYQLSVALLRQGKREQAVSLLEGAFVSVPALLSDSQQGKTNSKFAGQNASKPGWMYDLVTSLLMEQGKPERALGWAKVRWMTADFNEAEVGRAARMLAKYWALAEPKGTGAITFVTQQKQGAAGETTARTGAYDKIALPKIDATALQAQFREMQNKDGKTVAGQSQQKVSLHILLGQWNEAMAEAIDYLLKRPTAPERIQGVARVLKAADGDMVRANAFISYFREGQGVNPLEGFFKDYPKAAAVTETAPFPPVVLLAQVATVSGKIKPGAAYAAPIPDAVLTVPVLAMQADQSKDGAATIEAMWKQGLLSVDDAIYGLARGGIDGNLLMENHNVKALLAGLIVRYGQVEDRPELRDPRVRLAIGDYYHKQGDLSRAEVEFLSLAQQSRSWYHTTALERLTDVYRDQHNDAKVEEIWSSEQKNAGADVVAFNRATLLLAHQYVLTNQTDKAKSAYAQITSITSWSALMAVWDRAHDCMRRGEYIEARQILEPVLVEGVNGVSSYVQEEGRDPQMILMALRVLLGTSYYKTGDIEMAKKCAQRAVATYQTGDVIPNLNMEWQGKEAENLLKWSFQWEKTPLISSPSSVSINNKTLTGRISIRSFRPSKLEVTSSNPKVKVQLVGQSSRKDYFFEQQVEWKISPEDFSKNLQTTVTVAAQTEGKSAKLNVPLTVLPN